MGCLLAIGIYTVNQSKLTKINSSKKSNDQLKTLEQTSLQTFMIDPENFYRQGFERHYLKKDVEANVIIAIVSKNELSEFVLSNLHTNIRYILKHSPLSLDDIVNEPLNYMGQDYFKLRGMNDKVDKTKKTMDEIKQVMVENIDILIKRGEKIETLIEKTQTLKLDAEEFNTGARKLNSCCRYW